MRNPIRTYLHVDSAAWPDGSRGAVDVREGWETRANTNPCKPSWCHNVNRHDQLTAHRLEKAGISLKVEIGNQHWLPFPSFFWDAHDLAGRGRTVIPRHTTTTVAVAGSAHHLEARAGPMLLGIQESRTGPLGGHGSCMQHFELCSTCFRSRCFCPLRCGRVSMRAHIMA